MPKNAVTKILSTKTKTHKKLKNPPALLPRCQCDRASTNKKEKTTDNSSPSSLFSSSSKLKSEREKGRLVHSEVQFRVTDELDLVPDDFFCTYMDFDKLGSCLKQDNAGHEPAAAAGNGVQCVDEKATNVKLRHKYSNSVDGSSLTESIDSKKGYGS
ncbi:hypothetical protein H0E87_030745 [Populus deltoides]|uniref:Uncharacterized protein n=1 Tax=Populus deltoides TaxID=3696 RepID=A0A8T2WGS0_POPDE|nr:hypothetical protein H0E87_030745 [Populus deltoides]